MSVFQEKLLALLGPVMRPTIKYMSKRRLPKINGEINLPGLEGKVSVTRDKNGVAHISAISDHDLFFVQGFLHAQDRLWQMELNRRTASGTLSELFGSVALDTDRTARVFGWRRIGKKDLENIDDKLKKVISAYTKGVNAHINSLDTHLPVEFSLVKHKPDLWTEEDSFAIIRLMIWQLSHAWYGELIRAKLIDAVGPEHAAELEINYPKENPNTLPDDIEFNIYLKDVLQKAKGPFVSQSMGSNSWVISKEKSATGKPILSNDMHLVMSLPSIWHHMHLRSTNFNVSGVSVPGVPLILVGHNKDIAWGMTLAFSDAQDLFIEKFSEDEPDKYYHKEKLLDADIIKEQINIKGEIPHVEKVVITRNGPIISDVIGLAKNQKIAINSMALKPNSAMQGWYDLNRAKNWDDFATAIQYMDSPQLNVTFADSENIGYYMCGKVPKRAKEHTGMVPVPAWTGEYDWKGFIPFEKMPHALNPERGFIVTCNNKVVSDNYKPYLGNVWMNGYRAKRIEDYFESLEKISIEDSKKMMMDFYCLPGVEFIQHLQDIELNDHDPRVNEAFDILKNWDGYLDADSVGGCLYSVTKYMAVKHLYEPHLGKELTETIMGNSFNPILLSSHEFYGHDTVTLLRMLDNHEDSWWVKHAGGKEKLLRNCFNRAYEYLRDNLGLDPTKWQWGSLHTITFKHSMAIQKPMDYVFNKGPYRIGGDTDTPCQMAVYPDNTHQANAWVPSWRQIIDMGDIANSIYMYAPGQSGQVASKHYSDLINKWIDGEFFTMRWTRGQIENNAEGTLDLLP